MARVRDGVMLEIKVILCPTATATEQLDKLIPQEGRKTLKIKTAVRIGKPYQQIIQFVGW
jgi:hypothetical protein